MLRQICRTTIEYTHTKIFDTYIVKATTQIAAFQTKNVLKIKLTKRVDKRLIDIEATQSDHTRTLEQHIDAYN